MRKEVYDTREIILGLRRVYQDTKRQLEELKKYVTISQRISDCSFFLYPYGPNSDDYSIYFKYLMCPNQSGFIRGNQYYYTFSNVYMDLDNKKVFLDNNYVKVKKHEEFIDSANSILKSDFAKLIVRNDMKSINGDNYLLYTTLNEINLFVNQDMKLYNSLLSYDSYNDQLDLTIFYNISVNKDYIYKTLNEMLDINFHKGQFSNYIYENVNDVDTNVNIDLYNYRTNYDNSKTYIFGIDNDKKLIKSEKTIF